MQNIMHSPTIWQMIFFLPNSNSNNFFLANEKKEALTNNNFSNEKSCAISQFHKWKKIMHGPTILQMKNIMH
jgi:hypothetical protein